jgi:hypothetical protein
MRRLLLVSFTAAVAAAGSMLGVSPANAAPAAATCKPGVIIAASTIASPRVVHAGQVMTFTDSYFNCTAKPQPIMIRVFSSQPSLCGPSYNTLFGPIVMKPHEQDVLSGDQSAPACLGRYGGRAVITLHGKVVVRTGYSYTVIK